MLYQVGKHTPMGSKAQGFTLIELIITLVIVAILTTMAVPSYTNYVTNARRTDGQIALIDMANRMEKHVTTYNTYPSTISATGTSNLANMLASTASAQGYYNLSIKASDSSTYTIEATATGKQTKDTACASLTLNQLGVKGIGSSATGTADECW